MNKVGRPSIYKNEIIRRESRKLKNRENQRRCRLKKRLLKELSIIPVSKEQIDNNYRTSLVRFQKQFDYNYFFTGTVNLNHLEREQLEKRNDQIIKDNQEFELETGLEIGKRIGINSLRRYTERYLKFLYGKSLFQYCFVVFEQDNNGKYHTHILFKTDPQKINFNLSSERSWLMGTSLTVPIPSQEDKGRFLRYSVKEIKPTSTRQNDQNKVDNWFIWGDMNN